MPGPYLLGVDIGGTLMKTALFDLQGNLQHMVSREYPILHPVPSAAEHDTRLWLKYFRDTIKEILTRTKSTGDDIIGIGIDCLCPTLIPVDKHGNSLRNSIFFMDRRNIKQSEYIGNLIGKEEDIFVKFSGNQVKLYSSGLSLGHVLEKVNLEVDSDMAEVLVNGEKNYAYSEFVPKESDSVKVVYG